MTLLFGLFSPSGESVPDGLLDRIEVHCEWPRDRVIRHEAPGLAMLALQRDTVPRVGEARIVRDDGTALLFDGRIDNRAELAARYGLGPVERLDDEDLVHAAWRAEGPDLCKALLGDFTFAIHDPATAGLVLARDHLGVLPLYHARAGPFVAFASGLASLRLVPGLDTAWSERWIAEFLVSAKRDVVRTAYRAIQAVPPAHVLTFDRAGSRSARFWTLSTQAVPSDIGDSEATAEFGRLLDQAVACRLRAPGDIACELSGGLDSSAITAIAAEQLAERGGSPLAFSHGIPEAHSARGTSWDESAYVDAMLAEFPRIEHRWTDDAVDSLVPMLERSLACHGAPPRSDINAYADNLPCILQERGVRVLLSGFGGDQVVTSSGAGYTESLVADRDWATLREVMNGYHGRLRGAIRWGVLRSGLGAAALGRRSELAIEAGYTRFADLAQAAFIARMTESEPIDRHAHRARSGTMRVREAASIASPSLVYRLQDCATGASGRGFAYRYPMLDIRLVEFAHNLPTRLKRSPAMQRRMIRETMRGRLPEPVRLRAGKDGSTFPEVMINAVTHASELAALIGDRRGDPRVASYANFDLALETLARAIAADEFVGPLSIRDVLCLAMLCSWADIK